MTDALATAFPQTLRQTCIVHLLRNSLAYVPHKEMRAVCSVLRAIYTATAAEEGRMRLDEFAESELGKKHPTIAKKWYAVWEQVVPFFEFPEAARKLIYTTNSIEALNRRIRKVIKTRGMFPSGESAYKLVWLALMNSIKQWCIPVGRWREAMSQMAIVFEGRI